MCSLSSGTEPKTILPKKEKLRLRHERWLQSKFVSLSCELATLGPFSSGHWCHMAGLLPRGCWSCLCPQRPWWDPGGAPWEALEAALSDWLHLATQRESGLHEVVCPQGRHRPPRATCNILASSSVVTHLESCSLSLWGSVCLGLHNDSFNYRGNMYICGVRPPQRSACLQVFPGLVEVGCCCFIMVFYCPGWLNSLDR